VQRPPKLLLTLGTRNYADHLIRLAVKWQGLIISAINITRPEPYQAPEKFLTLLMIQPELEEGLEFQGVGEKECDPSYGAHCYFSWWRRGAK